MRDQNGTRSRQVLRALQYCFSGQLSPALSPARDTIPPEGRGTGEINTLRVLVVEDNPGDVLLMRTYLANARTALIAVDHAPDLHQACEKLRANQYDAVLLDMNLPDARGLSVVTEVLDLAPSTPILVISGESDEAIALEAVRRGAQDYLVKDRLDGQLLGRSIKYAIERLRHEARLEQLAHHDDLTGLANRLLFFDRLAHALDRAERDGTRLALLFLDLDHFKAINDSLGHATGDRVLQVVATRIESTLRQSDTVALLRSDDGDLHTAARLGGDEFAILLENAGTRASVGCVAERLLGTLREPVTLSGQTFVPTTSIGIACYPDDGRTREDLLACADSAMYRAKRSGRNNFQMRSEQPSSPAPKPEAQPLATTLRTALDRGELAVLYQARYDLRTLRPAGAEATLRLRESEANGRTAPITLGLGDEHAALLIELGRYLLSAACAKLAKHQRDRTRELRVAVDVCGPLLATPDFPAFVQQVLSEHDLPPRCLELQVGERALAFDSSACGAALAALGEQGVRLSFDDFLIADAQVSRLRDYDVDTLKLDGTFVREIERSRRDAAAARGVIEFAHRLGLEVVASGVETEAQLELLRSAGCDLAQGHLLSQPAAELPGDRPRARTRSAENALPAPPPPRSGH